MNGVLLVVAIVCVCSSFVLPVRKLTRRAQRRIYWGSTGLGALSGFFAAYPNSHKGLGIALAIAVGMVLMAVRYTPYLKIGGRIYALDASDRAPDPQDAPPTDDPSSEENTRPLDPYGNEHSPSTIWWCQTLFAALGAAATCFCALGRVGIPALAVLGSMTIVFAALGGYVESSWRYPIARGNRLQFGIASIVTMGLFPMVYLSGYFAGRKWPLRNAQSTEHSGHSRTHKH